MNNEFDRRNSLHFFYPSWRDVATWIRNYEEFKVPDLWPYGLNFLTECGVHADWHRLPQSSNRLFSGLQRIRALAAPRRKHSGGGSVSLTWDEFSAVKLASLPLSNSGFIASGVIWCTDVEGIDRLHPSQLAVMRTLRGLDMLWCLARPQVEDLRRILRSGHPPIEFIKFGIDTDFFQYEAPHNRLRVLSVGGDKDRDTQTLFEALAIVHAALPTAELVVQTKSQVTPPRGVSVIPHLSHEDLRRAYAEASVVVVATRPNRHVSGMTVSLESMATGRPVVATRTPGFNDYLVDGVTGVFVEPFDSKGLASEVVRILSDSDLCAEMGLRARQYVQDNHTSRNMANEIARVLRKHRAFSEKLDQI